MSPSNVADQSAFLRTPESKIQETALIPNVIFSFRIINIIIK